MNQEREVSAAPNIPASTKTEPLWFDNFKTLDNWSQELPSEHRTNNKYINPTSGKIDWNQDWSAVNGRRAALYTPEHRGKVQFINNAGFLELRALAVKEKNLYRDNFTDNVGVVHPYGDYTLHGVWLQSKKTLTRGSVLEIRVNLEDQCMRGNRFSFWLVPKNGDMYQSTVEFCEIDVLEVENAPHLPNYEFGDQVLMKIVGGKAGDTKPGQVDFGPKGMNIDIRKGWRTFTLVWNPDGSLEFYCDGKLCNSDPRFVTMEATVIISCELCSGVKGPGAKPWENESTGPKMPEDSGLTGTSVVEDVINGQIEKHRVLVDYVAAWKITGRDDVTIDPPPVIEEPTDPKIDNPDPVDPSISPEDQRLLIADYESRLSDLRQTIDEQDAIIEQQAGTINEVRDAFAVFRDL